MARLVLSPEFRLVAACCRWPPTQGRADATRRAAAATLDWDRVRRIAERQRVEGLVNDALSRADIEPPRPIATALRNRARDILHLGVRQAAESSRLQRLFEADGIEVMVLKGAAVEMLAYGRLGLKSAWDIDLLVAPGVAARARDRLIRDGYDLVEPSGLTPERFERWVELSKECEFKGRSNGLNIELHWRLTDNPALLADVSAASHSQSVALATGAALRTLAPAELYAYLCVHGAMHGWHRLKWLADVAALLARETEDGVLRLHASARALGAELCSAQALLLCERLLGTVLPSGLAGELNANSRARWLSRAALHAMAGGQGELEIEDRAFEATRILLTHFLLGAGWRFTLAELQRKWIGVSDRMAISLPRPLHFLYHVLRLPLWAWRRVSGLTRHA